MAKPKKKKGKKDRALQEVFPASRMNKNTFRLHITHRHVRHTMTKQEHDKMHEDFPKDYAHIHTHS